MMAVLDDVDAWLIAGALTDVFLSYLPDGDGVKRAVIEAPASAPGRTFKSATNAISYARIQVLAGGQDYPLTRTACQEVIDRLIAISDETISGTRYLTASTINDPFLISRDDSGRSIITGSVELVFTS